MDSLSQYSGYGEFRFQIIFQKISYNKNNRNKQLQFKILKGLIIPCKVYKIQNMKILIKEV